MPNPTTPKSAIYLLPPTATTTTSTPTPSQTKTACLTANHDPTPLPKWSLTHHLFRSTAPPAPAAQPANLQILALANHSPAHTGNAYIAITPGAGTDIRPPTTGSDAAAHAAAGPGSAPARTPAEGVGHPPQPVLTTIPTSAGDDFVVMLASRFGPLWAPRQVLSVAGGVGFEVGRFQIRWGELRQGAGGVSQHRGTIVEICCMGELELEGVVKKEVEVEAEMEAGTAEREGGEEPVLEAIREFWKELGGLWGREFVGLGALADVGAWCEALRVRV